MRAVPCLALLVTLSAFAQGGAPAPARTPAAAPAPLPDTLPGGTERASEVPPAEKIRRSGAAVAHMRQVLKAVNARLEEARAGKDAVKLNCVNDKVTRVKGLLRISEQAHTNLQESVRKTDDASSDREYTKVSIARLKVDQLRVETNECIGELAARSNENVSVEVEEPGLPAFSDIAPFPPITRPPPASPIGSTL